MILTLQQCVTMELYATDLKLSFVFCSYFPLWSNLVYFYLLPCTTAPACQPEAVGLGMAIRVGSARREIKRNQIIFSCLR